MGKQVEVSDRLLQVNFCLSPVPSACQWRSTAPGGSVDSSGFSALCLSGVSAPRGL